MLEYMIDTFHKLPKEHLVALSVAMARHPLERDLAYVLDETKDLWADLRGQRLFITGGTGFVGTWLVETFVWANRQLLLNATVTVLSRNPERFRDKAPEAAADPSVTFLQGSLSDFEIPAQRVPVRHPRCNGSNRRAHGRRTGRHLRSGISGYEAGSGTRPTSERKRLLFTSSGAVYGKQPPDLPRISEDYPGAPETTDVRSGYGQAKRASEFLCTFHGQQYGFEPIIARLFAFAGPHLPLDLNFAIGNFVRDALGGGPIRIAGDGTPKRSYLYAADLAVWLWTILLRGQACAAL